ncbi:MAG: RHS repeat protein [Deltaproteobacteria bacterium]|nr:RHS repeat protein [Deltaproteobacteria bacterium]
MLISITERNGNTTTLSYVSGYLYTVTDKNTRTLTFQTSNGKINSISSSANPNAVYTFGYDGDKLTTITDPDNNPYRFTYYTNNSLLKDKIDPMRNTTTYTYYDDNRIETATDPETNTIRIDYDTAGNDNTQTVFVTMKDTGTWEYKYSKSINKPLMIKDPYGNATYYEYTPDPNNTAEGMIWPHILKETADDNSVTTYTYDMATGDVGTKTDALGNVTSYTYNDYGQIETMTGPGGFKTIFTYDLATGNLTEFKEEYEQGLYAATYFGYSGNNLNRVQDPDNVVTDIT